MTTRGRPHEAGTYVESARNRRTDNPCTGGIPLPAQRYNFSAIEGVPMSCAADLASEHVNH